MRTRWFLAGAALIALAGLLAVPSGVARAATTFTLSGFNDVVVDAAHGHVFVSPGTLQNSSEAEIVVTDLTGKVTGAITGLSEPSGMALSADGKTLYVALSGADEVVSVDTTTLEETSVTYPLPSGYSPVNLAVESGKLWVSYSGFSDTTGTFAGIGEIDLSAASPAFVPNVLQDGEPGGWYNAPALAVDPLGQGTLVAYDAVDEVSSFDVATSPPTALARLLLVSLPNNVNGAAVLPGGTQFVLTDISGNGVMRFSTATGQQLGTWYTGVASPATVITAANGLVAVGTAAGVFVFRQGATGPQNEYGLASPWVFESHGLAFASDGSYLAGVADGNGVPPYTLAVHSMPDPGVTASSISLGGTSSAVLGKTVTLAGKLAYTVGTPAAKTRITITRKLAGSTATRTFTVQTAAGGSFRLTDTPSPVGTYTYTASYAGDTSHQPSAGTRTVDVLRCPVSLTLADSPKTASYHQRVTLTAHLGKTYRNRTVSVYALPHGAKAKKLLKSGPVNSEGNISVSYVPSYDTTFSAAFTGDAKYAPQTASLRLGVRASVSQAISGYYKSTDIGGVRYREYHQASKLTDHFTVTPNHHGQCANVVVQVHYQGQWQSDVNSGCLALSSASSITGQLGLSGAAGFDFRIRAALVHSDSANLASNSSWAYFAVTS
jgi:hypothetical protein